MEQNALIIIASYIHQKKSIKLNLQPTHHQNGFLIDFLNGFQFWNIVSKNRNKNFTENI